MLSNKSNQEIVVRNEAGENHSGIFWDLGYIKPDKNLAIFFMTNILAMEYDEPKRAFVSVMKVIKP